MVKPSLPAYLILLGFRYHDQAGEEGEVPNASLFHALHEAIKDIVDVSAASLPSRAPANLDELQKSQDLDILMLWLVNSWRLLQLLRQYGPEPADPAWHTANTPHQVHRPPSAPASGLPSNLQPGCR